MKRVSVATAAVISVLVLAAAAVAGSEQASGASLALVLSPSAKASASEIAHARQVFTSVSALPSLWLLGIYEQRTSNDGPPFNSPFVQTATPRGIARPGLEKMDPCNEHVGTDYQNAACAAKHAATKRHNKAKIAVWNRQNKRALDKWRAGVDVAIARAGTHHEEAPRGAWDLAGTLGRLGDDLAFSPAGPKCAVLLGGLVVQSPPRHLDVSKLAGVRLLVTGWRGTEPVRDSWTKIFDHAHASIEFLPADVTDIGLVDAVSDCVGLPH
jgi:hypothetical protein